MQNCLKKTFFIQMALCQYLEQIRKTEIDVSLKNHGSFDNI